MGRCTTAATLALMLTASAAGRQIDPALETEVKATFLFQFSRYVQWPSTVFGQDPRARFKVCTLADAAFNVAVDRILAGESALGRPMVRVTPDTVQDARVCQILYVARSERSRGHSLLASLQDVPVLTVSDSPDAPRWPGVIAFVRDDARIRFDVNLPAGRQAGLTLRSQLLRVARQVIRDRDRLP